MPHDAAYKNFFSDPEMVASLLQDFVPEHVRAEMDFTTLERSFASYVTDDLRERHDDIIWRVRWKKGDKESWFYIYLLLEFQSSIDPWMAVRILGYTALLWQDLIKEGSIKVGDKLPPVFPIVLYNGANNWTAARDTAELLPPITGPLAAYQPRQKYFLLDEGRVPEEELTASDGLVALLLRLERAKTYEEILPVIDALLLRLHEPRYAGLRRAFTAWINRVAQRAGIIGEDRALSDLQEVRTMLMERAAQWKGEYIQQGVIMGRQEGISIGRTEGITIGRQEGIAIGENRGISIGRQEGRTEGISIGRREGISIGRTQEAEFALRELLEARFGLLPEEVSSAIAGIDDVQKLRELTRSVLWVESLDAFTDELKKIR